MSQRRPTSPTPKACGRANARNHAIVLRLNERERQALDAYCQQMRITNRARFLREVIMSSVITEWEASSPMLFSEEEMR